MEKWDPGKNEDDILALIDRDRDHRFRMESPWLWQALQVHHILFLVLRDTERVRMSGREEGCGENAVSECEGKCCWQRAPSLFTSDFFGTLVLMGILSTSLSSSTVMKYERRLITAKVYFKALLP